MSTVLSQHIFLKLSSLGRTFDCSVFIPIVHIAVIDKSESTDCHLLAVTHAGTDQLVGKEQHDYVSDAEQSNFSRRFLCLQACVCISPPRRSPLSSRGTWPLGPVCSL